MITVNDLENVFIFVVESPHCKPSSQSSVADTQCHLLGRFSKTGGSKTPTYFLVLKGGPFGTVLQWCSTTIPVYIFVRAVSVSCIEDIWTEGLLFNTFLRLLNQQDLTEKETPLKQMIDGEILHVTFSCILYMKCTHHHSGVH